LHATTNPCCNVHGTFLLVTEHFFAVSLLRVPAVEGQNRHVLGERLSQKRGRIGEATNGVARQGLFQIGRCNAQDSKVTPVE
jgi:hypothetical protein